MIPSGASNADIQLRIRAGDVDSEAELFRRFGLGIKQILIKWTGDPGLAEELCQETLIVVIKRLRTQPLDDPDGLPAFIAQTARNLAIAERRKERRRRTDVDSEAVSEVMDSAPGQERHAEQDSTAAAVATVLSELKSPRDRQVIVRYYLRDDDKEVICRELGVSERNFNLMLFRARNRLLELLQRRGFARSDLLSFVLV